jgi:thiamine kinase-like enzyme
MNIVFSDGGDVLIDFEIARDSHVYFNNGTVDFYREWEEVPDQDREKFLKIAELMYQTLNAELTKLAK